MQLADQIRKHGSFSRWYEGELSRSHMQLLLCFLAAIALVGSVEAFSATESVVIKLLDAVLVLISGVITLGALRRYLATLMYAEYVAGQAVCPNCQTYARFVLEPGNDERGLRVACKKCSTLWDIRS